VIATWLDLFDWGEVGGESGFSEERKKEKDGPKTRTTEPNLPVKQQRRKLKQKGEC